METKQDMRATYYYLMALTEPEGGRPFTKDINELGEVQLYVYRDKHAPNRIAYMRKPRILVYDKRNNALSGYAAVFLCDTPEGNDFLATMEDLAHTRWHQEEARNWSSREKEKGRRVLKNIRDWAKSTLQSLATQDQQSEQDIVDLADFLPADDDTSTGEDARGTGPVSREGQDDPETGLEVPRPVEPTVIPPRRASNKTSGLVNLEKEVTKEQEGEHPVGLGLVTGTDTSTNPETGGSGGPGPHGSGPGSGPEPPPGPGPGPTPPGPGPGSDAGESGSVQAGDQAALGTPNKERILAVEDVSFRSYARSATDYRVVLRANRDCEGTLHLRAIGEDSRYDLEVVRAFSGTDSFVVNGTAIRGLELKTGQSLSLDVEVRSDVKLSLGAGK